MLPWFAEKFTGWIIRVGATKRPERYFWAFPLDDTGEFQALSTKELTIEAVRTAIEAARSLGFATPYWLHREKVIMANPIHAQHGGKLGAQSDQHKVIEIVEAYVAAMKAGKVTIDHIGEIDLGGGRYIRTFVAQEKQ